jgi:HK97 family phage portal protein
MGIFNRLFGTQPVEERGQVTDWSDWGSGAMIVGEQSVDQYSAMQLLAVAGSVRYITDTISTLPVDVYRRTGERAVEIAAPPWVEQPAIDLDFISWCSQVLTSLLLHGNAFIVVTRKESRIIELMPVDPTSVIVGRGARKKLQYMVAGQPFKGELLHIRGMMRAGSLIGMSPLEYARQSIGGGLAAQEHAQEQLQGGMNMPGVIELPGAAQPAVMKAMGESWRKQRAGKRNRGLPGVLEGGAKWVPSGITPEQGQFLQTRQWTAAEIAGMVYLIDPSELGIPVTGTSIQYGNMEQRQIATTRRAFQPWMIRIEKALSSLLATDEFVKFNLDGLLRADSSARWAIYKIASEINQIAATQGQPPVLTTLEMRDFEDLEQKADT